MKPLLFLVFLLLSFATVNGQTEIKITEPEETGPDPVKLLYDGKDTMHQLYLEEEAEKILDIKYEKSGKKVKGSLSGDGKRVLIRNYVPGSKIKMTLLLTNGEKKEITRSSCYIDPVIPIL